jgi:hypothetical protein
VNAEYKIEYKSRDEFGMREGKNLNTFDQFQARDRQLTAINICMIGIHNRQL